jgi:hypothetical protein
MNTKKRFLSLWNYVLLIIIGISRWYLLFFSQKCLLLCHLILYRSFSKWLSLYSCLLGFMSHPNNHRKSFGVCIRMLPNFLRFRHSSTEFTSRKPSRVSLILEVRLMENQNFIFFGSMKLLSLFSRYSYNMMFEKPERFSQIRNHLICQILNFINFKMNLIEMLYQAIDFRAVPQLTNQTFNVK